MKSTSPLTTPRVRGLQYPDDLPGLLALMSAAEAAEHTGDDISEADLRAQLEAPGSDSQNNRWVIDHPDEPRALVGYGALWTGADEAGSVAGEAYLVAHPGWRRRGLGSALLAAISERSRQAGAAYLRIYADPEHVASAEFLAQNGFRPVAAYTEMRAETSYLTAAPDLPEGFCIRPYSAAPSPQRVADAFNTCYAGQWGHQHVTLEMVEGWLPRFDAQRIFLLFAPGDQLAGICRVEHSAQRSQRNGQPTGYIDAPGLVPALRSPELYSALLLHAARALPAEDAVIELEAWGEAPETIQLYQELGFGMLRQQYAYQRGLGKGKK